MSASQSRNGERQDDEALWTRFTSGDDEAFFVLVRRHGAALEDFIALLSGRPETAGREMLRAWRDAWLYAGSIGRFPGFRCWLFTLAAFSHDDPAHLDAMGLMGVFEGRMTAEEPRPDHRLPGPVRSLPPRERMPLMLVGRYGFSFEEGATVLRIPVARFRRRAAAAARRLGAGEGDTEGAIVAACRAALSDMGAPPDQLGGEACEAVRAAIGRIFARRGELRRRFALQAPPRRVWAKRAASVAVAALLIVGLNVTLFKYVVPPSPPPLVVGRLEWAAGDIEARTADGAAAPVPEQGQPVAEGTVLSTGPNGRAVLDGPNGLRVALAADTAVGMAGPTDLAFGGGRLVIDSSAWPAGRILRVHSANGKLELDPGRAVVTVTPLRMTAVLLDGVGRLTGSGNVIEIGAGRAGVCSNGTPAIGPFAVSRERWARRTSLLEVLWSAPGQRPPKGTEAPEFLPLPGKPELNVPALEPSCPEVRVDQTGSLALIDRWTTTLGGVGRSDRPVAALFADPAFLPVSADGRQEGATLCSAVVPPLGGGGASNLKMEALSRTGSVVSSLTHDVWHETFPDGKAGEGVAVMQLNSERPAVLVFGPSRRADAFAVVNAAGDRFILAVDPWAELARQAPALQQSPRRFLFVVDAGARSAGVRYDMVETLERMLVELPQPAEIATIAVQDRPLTLGGAFQRLTVASAEGTLLALCRLDASGRTLPGDVLGQILAPLTGSGEPVGVVLLTAGSDPAERASLQKVCESAAGASHGLVRIAVGIVDEKPWDPSSTIASGGRPSGYVTGRAGRSPERLASDLLSRVVRPRLGRLIVAWGEGAEERRELGPGEALFGSPVLVEGGCREANAPTRCQVEAQWEGGALRASVPVRRVGSRRDEWFEALQPLERMVR